MDGAMKLKLYVLSTAFDQSQVNSLSCSLVPVRALDSPCIKAKKKRPCHSDKALHEFLSVALHIYCPKPKKLVALNLMLIE